MDLVGKRLAPAKMLPPHRETYTKQQKWLLQSVLCTICKPALHWLVIENKKQKKKTLIKYKEYELFSKGKKLALAKMPLIR